MGCGWLAPSAPTCPAGMVLVPAGVAVLGTDDVRGTGPYGPRREVAHAAYCMDVYEHPGERGRLPTHTVTWDQADQLCRDAGKRLCTELEWERACRGPEGRRYSYGAERDAAACNTPIAGSGPGRQPAPLAASGAFPRCVTPEGIHDLNGNVSEWVADPWDGRPEPFNQTARVDPETWRTLRGGTMWADTFYGQECMSRHGHHRGAFKNIDDGFRCCADPAP